MFGMILALIVISFIDCIAIQIQQVIHSFILVQLKVILSLSTYISITTYVLILCTHLTLTTNPHPPQDYYSMLLVSIICKMFFIMFVSCSCQSCSVYCVIYVSCVRVIHVLLSLLVCVIYVSCVRVK